MGLLKRNPKLNAIDKSKYKERIAVIEDELFISVYHKIENSLLTEDKLLVALKFVQLRLGSKHEDEFKLMLEPLTLMESTWRGVLEDVVNPRQLIQLEQLARNSSYSKLKQSLSSNEK